MRVLRKRSRASASALHEAKPSWVDGRQIHRQGMQSRQHDATTTTTSAFTENNTSVIHILHSSDLAEMSLLMSSARLGAELRGAAPAMPYKSALMRGRP